MVEWSILPFYVLYEALKAILILPLPTLYNLQVIKILPTNNIVTLFTVEEV